MDLTTVLENIKQLENNIKQLYEATPNNKKEETASTIKSEVTRLKSKLDRLTAGDLTFRFGKFKGQSIEDVPAWYLLWCYDQDWFKKHNSDMYNYIKSHIKSIKKEVEETAAIPSKFD
jgi:uncharacterized protein (DUF3820 family)